MKDMGFSEDKINVFISYSWDDEDHKRWVIDLAKAIRSAGGNPLIDQTHLKFGGNIPLFMETMIIRSDVVLMILTPPYQEKADKRVGGVGYEYNIINDKLYNRHENEKYIPVLRNGDKKSSVPLFLQTYGYADLREGKKYKENLNLLLSQILKSPLKHPEKQKSKHVETKLEYLPNKQLEKEIDGQFESYFQQIFNISDESEIVTAGGAVIKTDSRNQKNKVKKEIAVWKAEVEEYCTELEKAFDEKKMIFFESNPGEFKSKSFRNNLWTVSSALKTPDPDLARYKKDFANVTADEVLETVQHILELTRAYIKQTASSLNYPLVTSIEELDMDFLNKEDMFLNKIIGFGIRSEILHRMFPAHFPIMTQRTLWAMYFLTDRAREFIAIEHKTRSGTMRVSHNWQYDYARFTYYNNYIGNLLQKKLEKFEIQLEPELRFGFVNLFLVELAKLHKSDIKVLHEWSEV